MKEAEVFDRKARDILLREIADIESVLISLHKTGCEKTGESLKILDINGKPEKSQTIPEKKPKE